MGLDASKDELEREPMAADAERLETGLREVILNLESLIEQAQRVLKQARHRLKSPPSGS